jgi:hypothetical protein
LDSNCSSTLDVQKEGGGGGGLIAALHTTTHKRYYYGHRDTRASERAAVQIDTNCADRVQRFSLSGYLPAR